RHPQLACRHPPVLCRHGGGRLALRARLSRRGRLGRLSGGPRLVRAHEGAALLPAAPVRQGARPASSLALRRPRLLIAAAGSQPSAKRLRAFIDAEARKLGFDAVGVTRPDSTPFVPARLAEYVGRGHHGTMEWMAETADRRGDPRTLWPDVRSVIMLGMNYGPDRDPLELLSRPDRGAISVYARHRDYHDIIKGRLKEVAQKLVSRSGAEVKVFVDTAPVMEKPLAAAAGIGCQGKHTCLVSREFGAWLFLGSIFTTAELPADEAESDRCGSCRACLDICPTDAFP